uniref:Uncharacterized protein n=1 Tax=Timema cristinae TaxID=61476 RepID=A0A7R9DDD0_TIMCR|nr:unnamed protein product [Timema cristinae]
MVCDTTGGKLCSSKMKPPPPIAPKPRPWSMVADRKSGEFSLPSDGSSSNTSAANTPDSGDALDESTDSGVASMGSNSVCGATEKRSVRELAANLNKHGGGEPESRSAESAHDIGAVKWKAGLVLSQLEGKAVRVSWLEDEVVNV